MWMPLKHTILHRKLVYTGDNGNIRSSRGAGIIRCERKDLHIRRVNIYNTPGNFDDNPLQIFDPVGNTWSTPAVTGTFTPRQYLATAVVNNKIYAIGGSGEIINTLNTLEVFDPTTNAWSTPATTGSLTPREGLVAQAVNNKIYVIGGRDDTGGLVTTVRFRPRDEYMEHVFDDRNIQSGI